MRPGDRFAPAGPRNDMDFPVLSLKMEKLSYLCRHENERIRQQDQYVYQDKDQLKFHLSPPAKKNSPVTAPCLYFILHTQKLKVNQYGICLMQVL